MDEARSDDDIGHNDCMPTLPNVLGGGIDDAYVEVDFMSRLTGGDPTSLLEEAEHDA